MSFISLRDTLVLSAAMFVKTFWPLSVRRLFAMPGYFLRGVKSVGAWVLGRPGSNDLIENAVASELGELLPGNQRSRLLIWANATILRLWPMFRHHLIETGYTLPTWQLYAEIMDARHTGRIFRTLKTRTDIVVNGDQPPLFVNTRSEKSSGSDITHYLRADDGPGALRSLEGQEDIPPWPETTAVVHLVVKGEGTYALISRANQPSEVLLCPTYHREAVVRLLKGWLWLYFWYRENMLNATHALLREKRGRALSSSTEAQTMMNYAAHQLVFNDLDTFAHYLPTEIPTNQGTPHLPLPVWILTEVFLRMIGEGYGWSTPGLWATIHTRLQTMGVKRLVVAPDPALAALPHHAAVLSVDGFGRRTYLSDIYRVSTLPWGRICQPIPTRSATMNAMIGVGDQRAPFADAAIRSLSVLGDERLTVINADFKSVQAALLGADALTYYGHAEYSWENPAYSCLHLEDRCLSLAKLSTLTSRGLSLAILAGCETGMPIDRDFSVNYSNVMDRLIDNLHCPSIVASAWSVNQLSTLLLVDKLHMSLLDSLSHGMPVNEAASLSLHHAQAWLRHLPRKDTISALHGLFAATHSQALMPEIERLEEQTLEYPYAHPYYWAPFYFIGGS